MFGSCFDISYHGFSALFQSLLFEACGRTVNPVNGAVGLLWTGNWHVCQAAVETVLRGGTLRPMPELLAAGGSPSPASDEASEVEVTCTDMWTLQDPNPNPHSRFSNSRSKVSPKRKPIDEPVNLVKQQQLQLQLTGKDLDLRLTPTFSKKTSHGKLENRRLGSPSMNSEESVTTRTTCLESGPGDLYGNRGETKLLNLFV